MDLVGKRVMHKAGLGEGTIVSQADDRVNIKFDSDGRIRPFEYPKCFSSFFKPIN